MSNRHVKFEYLGKLGKFQLQVGTMINVLLTYEEVYELKRSLNVAPVLAAGIDNKGGEDDGRE